MRFVCELVLHSTALHLLYVSAQVPLSHIAETYRIDYALQEKITRYRLLILARNLMHHHTPLHCELCFVVSAYTVFSVSHEFDVYIIITLVMNIAAD